MWLGLLSVFVAICTSQRVNSLAMGRLCGRELADTLDIVCLGRGFHWDVNKRSDGAVVMRQAVRLRRDVATGGIVDECCHHTCTVSVLERYCARPATNNLLSMLKNQMRTQFWDDPATPPTTVPPSPPPVVRLPTFTSQLASKPRKFNSYFYLHDRGLRVRSPLI